jgi:surface antigen
MVIFRIIRNLIRLALNLLWLPINLLTRNLFTVILLGSVIAFFVILSNDDPPAPQAVIPAVTVAQGVQHQPPAPPVIQNKNAPTLRVDAVRKTENGNSSFASDLLKMMTDDERAYYSQIFYWIMNNTPGGRSVKWENANTYGTITTEAIFLNSRGHACRKFTETLKVHDVKQTLKGVACQRGGGAWCKLGPNATPACGLGQVPSFWNSIKRSLGF